MELADVTDSKSVGSNTVWVRVPPPAPNTEAPVGCLCVWLSRTGLEAGGNKMVLWSVLPGRGAKTVRARSTECKQRYAALCSTHLICCILRRQISRKLLFCRCRLIGSSDKARSMPYKSPLVFRDFPPVYLLDCGKGGTLQKKCGKENIFSMTIDLPPVTARTVDRIRLPPYSERVTKVSFAGE